VNVTGRQAPFFDLELITVYCLNHFIYTVSVALHCGMLRFKDNSIGNPYVLGLYIDHVFIE
jgi:hypothetical protein